MAPANGVAPLSAIDTSTNHLEDEEEEGQVLESSPLKRTQDRSDSFDSVVFRGVCSLNEYILDEKLGDGTFGVVMLAMHKATKKKVALKRILTVPNLEHCAPEEQAKSKDVGIPVTTLREIKILKSLDHENLVELLEIAFDKGDLAKRVRGSSYMVFPYMDYDLTGLLGNKAITLRPSHIKSYMQQLLQGLAYLHSKNILHRDLKGANVLVNVLGELKLADFGLAKELLPDDGEGRMTATVCTLWYRAPELLLQTGVRSCHYTQAIDMWGAGCIFGEMWMRCPLFMGKGELDQLTRIFTLVGTPDVSGSDWWSDYKDYPLFKDGAAKSMGTFRSTLGEKFPSSKYQRETYDLLKGLLQLKPSARMSAKQALDSYYFRDQFPRAAKPRTSE
ncbi:serine/threonine protein kinase, CMGC, CDC2/CDK sub [Kappamyces sp. JEL0829]|nr:serine/threonine protein kinase, CMGC, CDC2/CDK sub [Kappamyces sp. JEL0829]